MQNQVTAYARMLQRNKFMPYSLNSSMGQSSIDDVKTEVILFGFVVM